MERFRDRTDAGRQLAGRLEHLASQSGLVISALPRGGVPVGFEIARKLQAPLQIMVVRKLGVPGHEEYAMGAIASGGMIFLNHNVIAQLNLSKTEVDSVILREERELNRRARLYDQPSEPHSYLGKTVILVDDGLATGSTMKVAVNALREQGAGRIVVAAPVAPDTARAEFEQIADEFVAVLEPSFFYAVGQYYEDFSQTTDEEVRELMRNQPAFAVSRGH